MIVLEILQVREVILRTREVAKESATSLQLVNQALARPLPQCPIRQLTANSDIITAWCRTTTFTCKHRTPSPTDNKSEQGVFNTRMARHRSYTTCLAVTIATSLTLHSLRSTRTASIQVWWTRMWISQWTKVGKETALTKTTAKTVRLWINCETPTTMGRSFWNLRIVPQMRTISEI